MQTPPFREIGRTVSCASPQSFADVFPRKLAAKKNEEIDEPSSQVPSTMPDALRRFFLGKERGPLLCLALILCMAYARIGLAMDITMADIIALSGSVIFWWFQEHFIHGALLHSEFDWAGKRIHAAHHENDYFTVSIDPAWLMFGWLCVAHGIFRCVLPLPVALSATVGYASAGLFYEWAHYIVHTRVKPQNGFTKRMRDNHVRHHLVNDRYWLSFSIPAIDNIFGTNPPVSQAKRELEQTG